MMSVLYHYIINPQKTLSYWASLDPSRAALLVLILIGMSYSLPFFVFSTLIISSVIWSMGIAFFLLMASFTWDFIMQLMGKESKSLVLFKWVCLSVLPMLLGPAFISLGLQVGVLSLFTVILQVMTLKCVYEVSYKRAILAYLGPALFFPTVILILFFWIGIWS